MLFFNPVFFGYSDLGYSSLSIATNGRVGGVSAHVCWKGADVRVFDNNGSISKTFNKYWPLPSSPCLERWASSLTRQYQSSLRGRRFNLNFQSRCELVSFFCIRFGSWSIHYSFNRVWAAIFLHHPEIYPTMKLLDKSKDKTAHTLWR